ncbi:hypothetical protein VN97_g9455 [Penicillium thymicola]|uniref:Uncharacterized protein n=1 Tax=Penicillium thymicola TaxID=293382 RepID=A0AAI9X579_PENTH|nr:hypothetical protein VN97_g9455 [Penicillium thymicola]
MCRTKCPGDETDTPLGKVDAKQAYTKVEHLGPHRLISDPHEFFAYSESNMAHPASTQRRCLSTVAPVKLAAVVGKDE